MSSCQVYMSGTESKQHFQAVVDAGVTHTLTSFLYLEKAGYDLVEKRKKLHPQIKFFVDSGAHTFIVDPGKYKQWSIAQWEDYLRRYTDWLRKNRQWIECAVELDIDDLVGENVVKGWQKKFFQPLVQEGINIIFVWHEPRGLAGWEQMCSDFAYVGLQGHLSARPDFNNFITTAKRYTAGIHAFAGSLTDDSLMTVRNSKGMIRSVSIGDLYRECGKFEKENDHETWGILKEPHDTWSLTDDLKSSFEPIRAVVKHRLNKKIYEIILRGGKTIKGTEDHSFFALNKLGNLVEVKPSNLKEGDCLVSSMGMPKFKGIKESDLLGEFLGLWFGDGHIGKVKGVPANLWICKQHVAEVRSVCEKWAKSLNCAWNLSGASTNRMGHLSNRYFVKWVVANFGRIGSNKKFGSFILSASKEFQAAFLRGYYSADGSAKGDNSLISLNCFRRDILEMVQILLERWDIRSGISGEEGKSHKIKGHSVKTGPCYELAICDQVSRDNFAKNIGFLQEDQNKAVLAKRKEKSNAGVHRGLPVSLLKSSRLFFKREGKLTGRPVYAKDRRTALYPENFHSKLLSMECEYLEVVSLKVVSQGWIDVYDLEVPTTQRFFGNGILAHNTKHSDFRDWPWRSIDSISWKNGEIYGMTIHWDESKAVPELIYDQDKSHRPIYRKYYDAAGLDGAAIVGQKPGAYKDLTKYCLMSFRRMEQYYERKYAARPAYYDVRMPHPRSLKAASIGVVKKLWACLDPESKFKQHAKETDYGALKDYVSAVGAVQNKDREWIEQNKRGWDFLAAYFPSLLAQGTLIQDMTVFQREMSQHITPAMRVGLKRVEAAHFVPTNNPPKKRSAMMLALEDLDYDPAEVPVAFEEL